MTESRASSKISSTYQGCALLCFNTLLALVVFNALLACYFGVRDEISTWNSNYSGPLFTADGAPVDTGQRMAYHLDWFDFRACAEVGEQHAGEVLDDFYWIGQQGFLYQPWVQFSEPFRDGKRVSVVADGNGLPVRETINPKPHDPTSVTQVFTFGGSTTFGYHVADEHTWPTYLSRILNQNLDERGSKRTVEVRNYGRGLYFPSQEVVLFADLLRRGERPAVAIFMDGVNLGPEDGSPQFTRQCAAAFARAQGGVSGDRSSNWDWLPMVRLAKNLRPIPPGFATTGSPSPEPNPPVDLAARANSVAERFRRDWRLARDLGKAYGVEVLVVLQPDAIYNYPLELFRVPLPEKYQQSREVRRLLHKNFAESFPEGVVDFSGLFEAFGADKRAIVDDCHYSPAFNRFLAQRVAELIPPEKLAGPRAGE